MSEVFAVVFDFDDTLAPDTTTKLLRHFGIDPEKFWGEEVKALVADGYDQTHAWLKLLFDMIGDGKPLGNLTNGDLATFGATVDEDFYPGLPELFDELREDVRKVRDMDIEFYVISGGLRDLIMGSQIVREHFEAVYACELAGDDDNSPLRYIKRCVTFTEKTRYLFEINKGIPDEKSRNNPLLVNRDIDNKDRRIQWENLIYVGDGLTDIPAFSLVNAMGGMSLGVFDPSNEAKAKRALLQILQPQRTHGVYAPEYEPHRALGSLIRQAVAAAVSKAQLKESQVYRG